MAIRPQTVTDLYLAPLALRLDHAIDALTGLDGVGLRDFIAERTLRTPFVVEDRRDGLLDAIVGSADLHGWDVYWDPRGLALSHGEYRIVLGLPARVHSYLEL